MSSIQIYISSFTVILVVKSDLSERGKETNLDRVLVLKELSIPTHCVPSYDLLRSPSLEYLVPLAVISRANPLSVS